MANERLREHEVVLQGARTRLRPMTEGDWDALLRWNQDAEVLYFADADEHDSHSLEEVQDIYRWVSLTALNFVIELHGLPVGECWLQQMNLPRLINAHPGQNLRRIDLMIGEKQHWGKGLGTEAISLLTRFGFEEQSCDQIFACGVADYNPRSMGAFRKCGYRVSQVLAERPGGKMRFSYDLSLPRSAFLGSPRPPRVLNTVPPLADGQLETAFPSLAQFVHIPADQQVLEQVLPDFEVCLLDESLTVTDEMYRGAHHPKRVLQGEDRMVILKDLREWLEGSA
jgi:RimJ/RimL family protein N-acetyltransferase